MTTTLAEMVQREIEELSRFKERSAKNAETENPHGYSTGRRSAFTHAIVRLQGILDYIKLQEGKE